MPDVIPRDKGKCQYFSLANWEEPNSQKLACPWLLQIMFVTATARSNALQKKDNYFFQEGPLFSPQVSAGIGSDLFSHCHPQLSRDTPPGQQYIKAD